MAYAALVSLENTIQRFLNGNLFSISVEEKQQITSLLEYVTPIRDFLEEFPNESKSWEEQMRELANEAEDTIEYLVLEKVFLPCEEESESHPSGNHGLDLKKVVKETFSKLGTVSEIVEEFLDDAKANSLKGRITEIASELRETYKFYKFEKTHRRFREKWRLLPSELAKLKPKIQFIHHLNKTRNDINSIMEEVMAIENVRNKIDSIMEEVMASENDRNEIEAALSTTLSPVDDIVGFPQDDADASKCYRSAKHELQLEKVMEEIASISVEVKNIKVSSSSKEVQLGADSSSQSYSDSLTVSSSSAAPPIYKNSLVGFDDHVMNIKERLCGNPSKLQVIPVCGMGGIGKTTLARNVYDDQLIKEMFDIRIWITVSQDYSPKRIHSDLLESLKEYNDQSGKEESADIKVYKILIGRKYLVVMDDIWRSEAWDIVRNVFPDNGDGSRIMLTTRLYDVASYPGPSIKPYELGLLDEVQSWSLLKEKVFPNQECPSDLENIGKDIARSCKGLPLAIVVIAGLLSTVTENPSSWLEVAGTLKSATTDEKNHIKKILSLSYVELPQLLRPCFLYMASFPEDHEIYTTKLIRLWIAEGFLKFPINTKSFEEEAEECLEELVKRNLVFVTKRKSDGRIKSCSLHDLIRELCIRKAQESKFFLNLMDEDTEKENFMDSIKNERRDGNLNDLVHLHRLENLEVYAGGLFRLSFNLAFPETLKRLILGDLKLTQNNMIVVGSLPNLQVLKLKGCTCIGGTWETTEGTFPVLEVLLVQRSQFENWITESGHFPRLRRLLLHSCRDLNKIPTDIGEIPSLQLIEVKGDVKESLLKSAEVIREEQDDMGNNILQVVCIAAKSS
ncbi:disease resistance RPP8-like protein 3 isoform X2 [Salvia hispanica]|uniref:disease resistance RPP8-like protein 3 isoform X2 n=1 Tax=Salvia hispanica TaxID=49212 RepID=UPI002009D017|nr:disease resistance RPP8-like protein 3 isoform X2 [Salvia hispanica]